MRQGAQMEKHGETGGKKRQAMKTGRFLRMQHFIGVSQIGFMMLNQNSGFESCAHLSGGMGTLGFSC